jgi:hypothetical protein
MLRILFDCFADRHSNPGLKHEGGEIDVVSLFFAIGDAILGSLEDR